jgi:hypothetical protein
VGDEPPLGTPDAETDGVLVPDAGGDSSGGDAAPDGTTADAVADVALDVQGDRDAGSADGSDGGVCSAGSTRCMGNTPQTCVAGSWQSQTPCSGTTPVCSNGACSTYRVTGGIRSTAPATSGSGVHLVSGGFELGARSCTAQGLCVTGGIVP